MPKIVNTALKAKAKAWTFDAKKAKAKATGPEAKAIKFGLEAKAWPRGLHHWHRPEASAKLHASYTIDVDVEEIRAQTICLYARSFIYLVITWCGHRDGCPLKVQLMRPVGQSDHV